SPHVEPDPRQATAGKAARPHAALVGHANFQVATLGRKLDGQPSAFRVVVKHARDLMSCRCASLIHRKERFSTSKFSSSESWRRRDRPTGKISVRFALSQQRQAAMA